MRAYLSSFRLGDHVEILTRLSPPPGPVAVIANACDDITAEARATAVDRELAALASWGYRALELDLRDHLDDRGRLRAALAAVGLIWVRGGNVFTLRAALARSGADQIIVDLVGHGAMGYGGYSAGACVLAPSLRGLERCDDPAAAVRVWGDPIRYDGLGLLDRAVVPHLDSPSHPESAVLREVADAYTAGGTPFFGLRDGDVLVVEGHTTAIHPRRSIV